MRWEALLADLAAGLDAEQAAERQAEVADRTRAEYGRLRLIDRLQPLAGSSAEIRLGISGHSALAGSVHQVGVDWALLTDVAGARRLVTLDAVQWVRGVPAGAAEPGWEGRVGAKLTLRVVLRRLVRDRAAVSVALISGDVVEGRLARVGADHVELSERDAPRSGSGDTLVVPIAAVAYLLAR